MIKVRGSYETEDEADARAETLIRTVDSYHKIFTAFVGKPFPATTSSDGLPIQMKSILRKK